jgi:hypothetical protein
MEIVRPTCDAKYFNTNLDVSRRRQIRSRVSFSIPLFLHHDMLNILACRSVALDHLTKYEFNEEKTCVIFAYYSYRYPERDNPTSLVSSFIKQLCSKLDHLPEKIEYFFRSTYNNAKIPAFEDMEPLLFDLLEAYSKVFIVIDALDECQALTQESRKPSLLSGSRPKYRRKVLDFINNLTSKQSFCAKVLVTSRREEDIKDAFDRRSVIKVDVALVDADIKAFLYDEIERQVQEGYLKLQDPSLKNHILDTLAIRAQGM